MCWNGQNASIKNIFQWLQIATTVVMFGWLVVLSMRTRQPVLSEDFVNKLIKSHEVICAQFNPIA